MFVEVRASSVRAVNGAKFGGSSVNLHIERVSFFNRGEFVIVDGRGPLMDTVSVLRAAKMCEIRVQKYRND